MAKSTSKKIVAKASEVSLKDFIVTAIQDRKGQEIVALDLKKINESIADYFIVCHGDSTTQVSAISDNIQKEIKEKTGQIPYRIEGERNALWIIVDYIDIVVHIFHRDTRTFYQLEDLWNDAPSERFDEIPVLKIEKKLTKKNERLSK